jgi:CRISPR-associated protein Cmr6
MRQTLWNVIRTAAASNFGHAYEVLAPPPGMDGKPDPADRDCWLARCAQTTIPDDYRVAYERWKRSFDSDATRLREVEAGSRLLIGHGNPSGAEVGLTVHRIWGVPVIPGSALKGLTAHYVDAVYGDEAGERRAWRGPTWTNGRVNHGDGAGSEFALLFGAPDVDGEEKSARGGWVEFHDALYVPDSAPNNRPFARDVLTVHQKPYYDGKGSDWPNDWTSPTPVGFVTVRPKTKFLLALTGPHEWTECAMKLLLEALKEWGIGGKTSAGYGRLASSEARGRR